ncbi:hypothetical protein MICRO8M_80322 [Microbacterium sp. 8M]|nr:hypothetical protein MICRO8M_80322 [Microbacterium sp. 8M]
MAAPPRHRRDVPVPAAQGRLIGRQRSSPSASHGHAAVGAPG